MLIEQSLICVPTKSFLGLEGHSDRSIGLRCKSRDFHATTQAGVEGFRHHLPIDYCDGSYQP